MNLGGLQKNSLIDYPGKISCVLFLSGCNFDCPYCHNPELARGCLECPAFSEENRVYDFLESRKSFLDGVVISGGEPTLQQDLICLCEKIKQMGYPVKLDTNGSRPQVIKELIAQGLIDYLAMDIKTDPFSYASWIKKDYDPRPILTSIQVVMDSAIDYEFRTTCIQPLVSAPVIESISRLIKGAKLYALQRFHHTQVLHPEFFHDDDRNCSDEELHHFKSVADPWVHACIVR